MHPFAAAAAAAVTLAVLPLSASAAPAMRAAPAPGDQSRLELVATVPYLQGTHIEHATIRGRDYVFAATQTQRNSIPADLRVIDVTQPARPKVVAQLACGRFQGNLQVSADRKTLL
ncbi:MAG TPA: hypothetical protein VNA30_02955, partial [Mycobacteriales bacterium]|nr:hypothetical protein [Mycobacteriales bacterium]